MTTAGLIATFGTQNALTMAFARLPVALAEDDYLPLWLRWRTRSGALWPAIALCAAVWMLCLLMSFSKLLVLDVLFSGFPCSHAGGVFSFQRTARESFSPLRHRDAEIKHRTAA